VRALLKKFSVSNTPETDATELANNLRRRQFKLLIKQRFREGNNEDEDDDDDDIPMNQNDDNQDEDDDDDFEDDYDEEEAPRLVVPEINIVPQIL
jgi:hypothetical protein